MAVEKSDAKPAQAGDQAKATKKSTKSGSPKLSNEERTLAQAKVWYGELNQAEGHQLRKRPASTADPAAPKVAKKSSTKKAAAPKKAKA